MESLWWGLIELLFYYSIFIDKKIAGRVINEMTAFVIVTVRPEQFQTGMFGCTGSKKYAMEYMRYQASMVP